MTTPEFIVGVPVCNETEDVLRETFDAIRNSTARPSETFIVQNGCALRGAPTTTPIQAIRPRRNIGCAGAWNLIHKLSAPLPLILVNADCAVAPDTFEKMLEESKTHPVVCAYGFGCFLISEDVWSLVGEFDEGFYPVYYEDTDMRRRLQLAGIPIHEWSIDFVSEVNGRKKSVAGISHGKHDPEGFQGWRGEKLQWFRDRFEANKARYIAKWGGGHTEETFTAPFGTPIERTALATRLKLGLSKAEWDALPERAR